MSQDREPGQLKDRSLLRDEEVRFQKTVIGGYAPPPLPPSPSVGPASSLLNPPPSTWHLCSFLTIFFQTKQCCFDAVGVVGFGGVGGGG